MNSSQILKTIDAIAAEASKNAKQSMVGVAAKDPDFVRVLEYAYNPFKTYGLRKLPIGKAHPGYKQFDQQTWDVLDALICRNLSGNAALLAVEEEIDALDEDSAELLRRIIRKDLRAGFSESTINKAVKGLIPEFPYMRCSLPKDTDLTKWPWERGVISQEKADGMFANVDHEEGGLVSIRSRQGTEFPMDKFADVAEEVRTRLLPNTQNHGEFLVLRDGLVLPRQEGNGIMNHVLSGGDFAPSEKPVFMVWDQIPLSCVVPKGKCETPYSKRLTSIITQLKAVAGESIRVIPTKIVKSLADAKLHAVAFMKEGKEGSVIKHPDAIWKDTTSKEQVKIKLEFVVDLEIVAVNPGAAGTKNEGRAGALSCRTSDGLLQVDVAIKNEKMRDSVDADPESWIGGVMGVVANDIMLPSASNNLHSLFLPRFAEDCLRDKWSADSLELVFAQKQAAIYGEELLKEAA